MSGFYEADICCQYIELKLVQQIFSNVQEIGHFDEEIATVLHYPSRQRQLGAAQQRCCHSMHDSIRLP